MDRQQHELTVENSSRAFRKQPRSRHQRQVDPADVWHTGTPRRNAFRWKCESAR
ncbi:hypothetical protein BZL30_9009 [Mycobacterium kansasii]|uniref:Uncharacterized protein n=1 Tax=Mycobacterium kansasii TaxID=1768 RepID=A0A1V3WFD6_MYCKA|nr:hypothetical protein BZL30_9009 [Mycobacterium kansasii]